MESGMAAGRRRSRLCVWGTAGRVDRAQPAHVRPACCDVRRRRARQRYGHPAGVANRDWRFRRPAVCARAVRWLGNVVTGAGARCEGGAGAAEPYGGRDMVDAGGSLVLPVMQGSDGASGIGTLRRRTRCRGANPA